MEETYPKEITLFYFNPDKRVYVGSVVLRNVPEALASVAGALGKEGINVVASELARVEGARTNNWGFFAEAEGPIDVEKTKALIEGTGNALKVGLAEGADGVVVDRDHYPLRYSSGHQAMSLRRENLVDMFDRVRGIFGSGANLIIYEMGVASGRSDGRALVDSIGPDLTAAHLLDLAYLYAAEGWGLPEVVDISLEPFLATVRFKDCFECVYSKSPAPRSQYLRGHLVGLAAAIFGKEITCAETKCAAMGEPYCEFALEEHASRKV